MQMRIKITPQELIQLSRLLNEQGGLTRVLKRARAKVNSAVIDFRRRQSRGTAAETKRQIQRGYYGRKFRGYNGD